MSDKLFVVLPAYNESENIERVVKDWHSVVSNVGPESRLLVVDDGSKDNTFELLQTLQDRYPQLIGITKPNSGHGATVLYA